MRAPRTPTLATTAVLGAVLAALAPGVASARTLGVRDEGRLHLVHSSGSVLIDKGYAHGSVPGAVSVRFTYNGNPNVSAQITIYAHGGSIRASGRGLLSNPNSSSPSFKGSLSITGGSGRYAHAHGGGRLYGVFYRRSYGLIVQTVGTLRY
jgi:hypothetical protein